jgi:hypothetical protein
MNRVYDFVPIKHNFQYIADVRWPQAEQLDWVQGVTEIEQWLQYHHMSKYSEWVWNWASSCYQISVAFKYDKHRCLFLINYG